MRGRTTFMIAHRLGTLANCDARLEIEGGRLVNFEQRILAAGTSRNAGELPKRPKERASGAGYRYDRRPWHA
jgi:hypothetical protein